MSRPSVTCGLAVALLALICSAGAADTFYVDGTSGDDAWDGRCQSWDGAACGPKRTIQSALDAAASGDSVLVLEGTYCGPGNKNLTFRGKDLALRGVAGATKTIIDCERAGRGLYFDDGETSAATVEGLTIRRGFATEADPHGGYGDGAFGGGVFVGASSLTIRHCVIEECEVRGYWARGGGFFAGGAVIEDCIVRNNVSYSTGFTAWGGGGSGGQVIRRCLFAENRVLAIEWSRGGGLSGAALVTDCEFVKNYSAEGGGIHCSSGRIDRCVFRRNGAAVGGAIFAWQGSGGLISNCLFVDNSGGWGGAIAVKQGSINVRNCTFRGNSGDAGTVTAFDRGIVDVANAILWNADELELYALSHSTIRVSYSNVQDGGAGGYDDPWSQIDWGPGLVIYNPQFVDPAAGNLRLKPSSPCIDAGDPQSADTLREDDLDGLLRVWDGDGFEPPRVDIGAYEAGSRQRGDLNCDGSVNAFDVEAFTLALSEPDAYRQRLPECDAALGDLNYDGTFNAFDVDAFVQRLLH